MEYQSIQHLPPPHHHHQQHHPQQQHIHYHYHRLQQHLQQQQQQQHHAQALASGSRLPRAVASALQDNAQVPSGRWSVSSEIAALRLSASSSLGTPTQSPGPTSAGNALRSVSVLSGTEYIRVVNARGAQRLVRRKLRQGAVPPAAVRGVGAKIHQRCASLLVTGLSVDKVAVRWALGR
ncbi:hypothetical protein RRG08_064649 [Elysia crispata]|uniref:Uncharacterized protein n=1 Tax=Elysia crispata TaxID=231223 RepID=A0AAE1BAY4_9GAST|nr:hypothetical protein RRG08_064649 [Elysia crispata]